MLEDPRGRGAPGPWMILVAGPYRSGTRDDPELIEENVRRMTEASLVVFRLGHLPVMGEWFALPLIEAAGSERMGDEVFDEIFHPVAERVLARCDACLRIGGPSEGADRMVEVARRLGKQVFFGVDAIPALGERGVYERCAKPPPTRGGVAID